jgi:ribosomal-protein-alanine N-acetyltransferase
MKLRRMTEADIPSVVAIEQALFNDPWSERSFLHEIKHNAFSIPLILEEGGEVIGYVIAWKIFDEFHIANIAIRPDYQNRGLGKMLMREILRHAQGCRYALLEVRENNAPAIHLYQKFGFRTIYRRPGYYPNGETALVMQKILENDAHSG